MAFLVKRGLSFSKRSGKPWTQEEYIKIMTYVGDTTKLPSFSLPGDLRHKFIYDAQGEKKAFMHYWGDNRPDRNSLKELIYEDIFPKYSLGDLYEK